MQWFRGGLVCKDHRLLYHSTLGLRVIKKRGRYVLAGAELCVPDEYPPNRKTSPSTDPIPWYPRAAGVLPCQARPTIKLMGFLTHTVDPSIKRPFYQRSTCPSAVHICTLRGYVTPQITWERSKRRPPCGLALGPPGDMKKRTPCRGTPAWPECSPSKPEKW